MSRRNTSDGKIDASTPLRIPLQCKPSGFRTERGHNIITVRRKEPETRVCRFQGGGKRGLRSSPRERQREGQGDHTNPKRRPTTNCLSSQQPPFARNE